MFAPVEAVPLRRRARHRIFEFMGVRYYRGGRYWHRVGGDLLHRAVWRANFGDIPDGHDIHHKDKNTSNCHPDNLECMPDSAHASLHAREPERIEKSKANVTAAVAAAASKRRRNPAWSSAINVAAGLALAEKLATEPKSKFQCIHCGTPYEVHSFMRKRGFCGAACQSAARRDSGKDDEQRQCAECRGWFKVNRYATTKCCSRHCAGMVAARARLQHHGR